MLCVFNSAEGGLKEAIRMSEQVGGEQATMQVECARRELAHLIMTRLPSRVAEAEPLQRQILTMLQYVDISHAVSTTA